MPNLRQERVRELLKRSIGEAIRREFHVNDVGLVTVNDIDMSGDLKSAIVFNSILGNADQQKRGLQEIENNRIRIQSLVAKSVVLKFTPTLKFVMDNSIVRGNKVLQIIEELEKTSPLEPEQPSDDSESE